MRLPFARRRLPPVPDLERPTRIEGLLRRAAEEHQSIVIYDRATGVYAYWYLLLRSEEELARASRSGRPLSYLFLWADSARHVPLLASGLKRTVRISDLAAYAGHGRFVTLLPDTPGAGARVVLARIRHVTGDVFSSAVASCPEDGATFDELQRAGHSRREWPVRTREQVPARVAA